VTRPVTRRKFCLGIGVLGRGLSFGAPGPGNAPLPFSVGIITHEISQDLNQTLDFIANSSLSFCELREIGAKT
jgi:hypothetical protein